MEFIEIDGNLFDSDASILCHQVNCCGCIGGGISGLFIKNEHKVLDDYRGIFTSQISTTPNGQIIFPKREELLGKVIFTPHEDVFYASMFGQVDFGADPFIQYTDYNAFRECLKAVREFAENHDPIIDSVAFPQGIGCGLGGGDWNIIKEMIQEEFDDFDGRVEIWCYKEEGI